MFDAQASSNADKFNGFADECTAKSDLDGWKVPDLSDLDEPSYAFTGTYGPVPVRPPL
jgi:hypothetical protein